jgi:hypothetical protein
VRWLDSAAINPANKVSFWLKMFGSKPKRKPFDKERTKALSKRLKSEIQALEHVLLQPDAAETKTKSFASQSNEASSQAGVKIGTLPVGFDVSDKIGEKNSVGTEVHEEFRRTKVDLLHRRIIEYQKIFRELAELSGGDSYLVLDDLYHIRRADQPRVIDYFHRLGKSSNLWIKIGTIRHRSTWYVNGDPPSGMKIGDDSDEIDLDLTLEHYQAAKEFLLRIFRGFFDSVSLKSDEILTDGALERLVLASGGVARDFLGIFRRSIAVARNRKGGTRGPKIGVEDVNAAAGEYDKYKREELQKDTYKEEETPIEQEFGRVREFCLGSANSNCFLIEKDANPELYERIEELTDLRLVHKVRSRVTVSGRPGKLFEAYMLDVSQYPASRKKRELEVIEFWRLDSTERLRRVSLIYSGKVETVKTDLNQSLFN